MRETVAAFRLRRAVRRLRLPPYPSPASFRTPSLAPSFVPFFVWALIFGKLGQKNCWTRCCQDAILV